MRTRVERATPSTGVRRLVAAVTALLLLPVVASGAVRSWVSDVPEGPYHILVIGSDADPVHGAGTSTRGNDGLTGRGDALHLVSLSADRTRASIVSFPRDTLASVPGQGTTKINAGLIGGPENMVATVEGLVGVDISDYVLTTFSGLTRMVDALGGLQVTVEQRLNDPSGSSSNLEPGRQRLTGWSTVAYSRDRYSRPNGDVGRSTGQATVLREIHNQYLVGASLPRILELIQIVGNHTATSLSMDRVIALAVIGADVPPEQVHHVQITGSIGTTSGGASVIRLGGAAEATFQQLRTDGVASPTP